MEDTSTPEESRWRPALPPKSAAVLLVAEEILKMKRGDQEREILSDSEIYDDIVTLRNTDDDIYDDIVVEVMRKQHSGRKALEANPQNKPQLAPKPLWLQTFLPAKRHTTITSYEDIYDDIVVQKMHEKFKSTSLLHQPTRTSKKPCPAPKPSGLYKHPLVRELMQEAKQKRAALGNSEQQNSDVDLEDIYDDIISVFACERQQQTKQKQDNACDDTEEHSHQDQSQPPNQINTGQAMTIETPLPGSHGVTTGLSAAGSESVYVNTVNSQDQLYDNECISKGRVIQWRDDGKTLQRGTPTAQSCRPRPQKKKLLLRQASAPESKLQSVGNSQTLPQEFQLSKTSPQLQHPSPTIDIEKRSRNDPLPTVATAPSPEAHSDQLEISAWDSEEEEEAYEYLPLYEDLEKFQDDGPYEEASTVVVKALNLPQTMRSRATRITVGQKKHLRKCLKKTIRTRSQTTPSGFSSNKPSVQQLLEYRNKCEETPAQDKAESSEEDTSDEAIPFGKSRLVFEMLLDASGIERIAESSQDSQKEAPKVHQEMDSQRSPEYYKEFFSPTELDKLQEDPEIKRYKDAGIISLRSKSDIAAEIEEITANVPAAPPPLPGLRRQRTSVITRQEKTEHKRFLLRHKSLREDTPKQSSQPTANKKRVSVPALSGTKAQEPVHTRREEPAVAEEQVVPHKAAIPHSPKMNYELKPGSSVSVASHYDTDDISHSYMNTIELRNLTPEPVPDCSDGDKQLQS